MELITFRQWLRQQEQRDDPIGDLAHDMASDKGQKLPNPPLSRLYGYISAVGACDDARQALIDAYREWQSYGNTYRETRDSEYIKPRHKEGWLKLRFRILKRDDYRCQLCGRTARDGVKLEVDHKLARAKHGSDESTNLWTLCFQCNRGKRDEHL